MYNAVKVTRPPPEVRYKGKGRDLPRPPRWAGSLGIDAGSKATWLRKMWTGLSLEARDYQIVEEAQFDEEGLLISSNGFQTILHDLVSGFVICIPGFMLMMR
jgi:hypothetical protein